MQGYVFLSEFLLRLEHDSDPESSEAIRYGYSILYLTGCCFIILLVGTTGLSSLIFFFASDNMTRLAEGIIHGVNGSFVLFAP
jgi:hypothetical protein